MKYIKLFEEISSRSQFYTDDEIKEFQSLSRRLTYNINKYLGGNFIRVDWCDNKYHPISVHYTSHDYSKDYSQQYEVDEEKMDIIKKSAIKIGVNKKELISDFSYFLLTKNQAKEFLADAKLKFYNIEVDELTQKYNL